MSNKIRLLTWLGVGLAVLLPTAAAEAAVCVTTLVISSTTFCIFQDANGNYYSSMGLYGIGGANQADVNASHQMLVTGPVTAVSGAFASGALASGSVASGAMVDLGSQANSPWVSGSGSVISILKAIAGPAISSSGGIFVQPGATFNVQSNSANLATAANQTTANTSLAAIASNTGAAIPTGANTIGGVTGPSGVSLATDAHLTALGTSALATDAHLTGVQAAPAASYPSAANAAGFRAQNAEPSSLATNGQLMPPATDLTGKVITSPYANKENMLRGTASTTGTGATTLIAAQTGLHIYVTGVQCKNTSGSVSTYVTLNDTETTGSGTILIVPSLGGDNETFVTPLMVATSSALTFTAAGAATTIYCNAQGYSGS